MTSLSKRLLPLLVLGVPLLFWLDLQDTFDLPKLTLVYLAVICLGVSWKLNWISARGGTLRRTVLDGPIGVFLLITAIAAGVSIEPALSIFGQYRIYVFGCVPLMIFAGLYWLTVQAATDDLHERITRAAQWSGAIVGFYAVLQYAGMEIFVRMPGIQGGRVWSSLGNPVYAGAVCSMALPLILSSRQRVRAGLMGVVCAAGLALSLSRGAWLGTCAALIYLWITQKDRRRFLTVAALGIGMVLLLHPAVRQRASVLVSSQESSNRARIEGWKAGLQVWRHAPWFGSGPDTFNRSFRNVRSLEYIRAAGPSMTQADAHNDFIQLLATEGALGAAAWIWCLIVLGIALFRGRPSDSGWVAALLALFVQNQFNFSSVSTSAWAAVGAGLLIVKAGAYTERPYSSPALLQRLPGRLYQGAVLMAACFAIWGMCLRPLWADLQFQQGQFLMMTGRGAQAFEPLRKSVQQAPRIEEYSSQLANADREMARQTADPSFRQALCAEAWMLAQDTVRRHPANPDSWNNRGVIAMWSTQIAGVDHREEARQSFQRAIELDSVFVDAWANLAKWEHLAGHLDEEKKLWKHVLTLDPAQPMALDVLGSKS